ncbi:TRAP transporter substrate-binding protein [Virgibacillus ainsalahensis]
MKKIIVFMLSVGLVLLVACSEDAAGDVTEKSEGGESITLVMNNHAPATHHLAVNAFDPWKEYVEEETDGRIKIDLYHGGSLGDAASAYDDIVGGAYDIGIPPSDYTEDTSLFPWTLSDLPFVFNDPQTTSEVVSQVMEEFAVDKMNENLVHLGTAGLDPSMIISVDSLSSAEEVFDMRISASSKVVTDLVQEWGATPVSLPYSETYEALQRNTTDAVIYTGAGSVGMSFYEVAPYYVEDVHPTTGTLPLVINKEVYDNIPSDLKEQFDNDLAPKLVQMMNDSYVSEMEAFKGELESQGVNFIKLPEEDVEKLKEPGKVIWDQWIDRANEKGYDGQGIVDRTIELLEERGVEVNFIQ